MSCTGACNAGDGCNCGRQRKGCHWCGFTLPENPVELAQYACLQEPPAQDEQTTEVVVRIPVELVNVKSFCRTTPCADLYKAEFAKVHGD